jgi:hyperosmotically inducible protein
MNGTKYGWILLLVASACNRATSSDENRREPEISAAKPAEQEAASRAADRAESEADRAVTERIRAGLSRESTLSAVAQNVQIVTTNGKVTLRGSVKTASQKMEIGRIAQGSEGASEVDNQLEVLEELGGT